MQEFDYSNETSNDLYDAVDGLSYEEAVFAKEAIEKIKEEKEEKKVMKFKKWFNEALFPILNEFAAVSSSRKQPLPLPPAGRSPFLLPDRD